MWIHFQTHFSSKELIFPIYSFKAFTLRNVSGGNACYRGHSQVLVTFQCPWEGLRQRSLKALDGPHLKGWVGYQKTAWTGANWRQEKPNL